MKNTYQAILFGAFGALLIQMTATALWGVYLGFWGNFWISFILSSVMRLVLKDLYPENE